MQNSLGAFVILPAQTHCRHLYVVKVFVVSFFLNAEGQVQGLGHICCCVFFCFSLRLGAHPVAQAILAVAVLGLPSAGGHRRGPPCSALRLFVMRLVHLCTQNSSGAFLRTNLASDVNQKISWVQNATQLLTRLTNPSLSISAVFLMSTEQMSVPDFRLCFQAL